MTIDELIALARQTLDREPKNWTDPACLTCSVQAMRMARAVLDLLDVYNVLTRRNKSNDQDEE